MESEFSRPTPDQLYGWLKRQGRFEEAFLVVRLDVAVLGVGTPTMSWEKEKVETLRDEWREAHPDPILP